MAAQRARLLASGARSSVAVTVRPRLRSAPAGPNGQARTWGNSLITHGSPIRGRSGARTRTVTYCDRRLRVPASNSTEHPPTGPTAPALGPWFAGRPLLVTANDRDSGLYNGDTGVLVRDRDGLVAAFGDPTDPLLVRPHRLPAVEPVYAMTDTSSSVWAVDFQAACQTFTKDHHVQAVLGYQFTYDGGLEACLTKAGVPHFETGHTVTPSPHHPIGAKGIGESATVGSPPAVVNAVVDALAPFGVRHADMPLTPSRVWEAMQGRATPPI